MIYIVVAAGGNNGFYITSEDKEVMINVRKFDIQLPTRTAIKPYVNHDNITTYSGQIIFETDNEIVIKDKIAYIK